MKFSVVITYYNRDILLHNTLLSYEYFYSARKDLELIVLEDKKTVEDSGEHSKLLSVLDRFKNLNIVHREMWFDNFACPCSAMDYAVSDIAKGEYIILSNPENMLINDVLSGFEEEIVVDSSRYVVPACMHLAGILHSKLSSFEDYKFKGEGKWIQHTIKHPKCKFLNHCTCIKRENYLKIGGFGALNGDFSRRGVDVIFIENVRRNFPVVGRDDLLVAHITHPPVTANPKFQEYQRRILNDSR